MLNVHILWVTTSLNYFKYCANWTYDLNTIIFVWQTRITNISIAWGWKSESTQLEVHTSSKRCSVNINESEEISYHVFIDMLDSFVNANNWINASNVWVPCFHILYITVYEFKARIYVPVVIIISLAEWLENLEGSPLFQLGLLYRFLFSTSKENIGTCKAV